jgi:hypothetical protein
MTKLEQIFNQFGRDQKRIAEWYKNAQSSRELLANAAWHVLRDESTRLANVVRKLIVVMETGEPEPYKHYGSMFRDISWRTFMVSTANCDHPLWTPAENVNFRIVHDVLGHFPVRAAFTWDGEIAACIEHATHLSELAQRALFTECIAQVAYKCVYGEFGPQKVVLV